MRPDIIPGAQFCDFELTDHTRQRRTLSELQGTIDLLGIGAGIGLAIACWPSAAARAE